MDEKNNAVSLIDASVHFMAGWVSGCAGILVSHPLDTVKVRLQTQAVGSNVSVIYRGTWHCLVETVKRETIRGLFKGISSPLLGTALWNAISFGTYGNTVRYICGDDLLKQHQLKNVFVGSLAAAIAQTFVICPLELTKTRLQIQSNEGSNRYKGLIDCIRKVLKEDGYRGLFRGYRGTMYRDLIGFPTYFCSFELIYPCLSKKELHEDLDLIPLILSGGLAGAFSWLCAFPHDLIKCRIQVDYSGKYKSFSDCFHQSLKEEGWMMFTKGLVPCVLRGFPMNAAIFSIYNLSIRIYEDNIYWKAY